MITTFVVGAGASKSVSDEYPLGSELKKSIVTRPPRMWLEPPFNDGPHREQIDLRLSRLVEVLQHSPLSTVDAILEQAHPNQAMLGKECIAAKLLPIEHQAIRKNYTNLDWLSHVATELRKRHDALFAGNIRFIIFNYDLLVEMMLYRMFRGSGIADPKAAVEKCWIQHVYGSLRYDLYSLLDNPTYLDYYNRHPDQIERDAHFASKGILLANEDRSTTCQSTLQTWSLESDKIIILGFGFDADNLNKFYPNALDGQSLWNRHCNVFASCFESGDSRRNIIRSLLGGNLKAMGSPGDGCMDFIQACCADWSTKATSTDSTPPIFSENRVPRGS